MDAVSPYFAFFLACVCGIPKVTLTGTPEDWREIRARIDVIEELDLHEWARSLQPIADDAARGCKQELELSGGLLGVEQDAGGALRPISAYVVRARTAGILDVIDGIVRQHRYALAFSANRTWRLREWRDRHHIEVTLSDATTETLVRWLDLPDGLFIAFALTHKGFIYALGNEQPLVRPTPPTGIDPVTGLAFSDPPIVVFPEQWTTTQASVDIPILGSSLAAILHHALEHDGVLLPREQATLDDCAVIPVTPRRPARV